MKDHSFFGIQYNILRFGYQPPWSSLFLVFIIA